MIGAPGKADYDAVVIGGGAGGLIAAAYLARSFRRVVLCEARDRLGGRAETLAFADGFRAPLLPHTVSALDPRVVKDLGLRRHGLSFAQRNMKLIALRPEGEHISLSPRLCPFLGPRASTDAGGYDKFRKEAFKLARRLRPLWRGDARVSEAMAEKEDESLSSLRNRLRLSAEDMKMLGHVMRLSAVAYLDRWIESDALKAALALDVAISGMSPEESGSALMLIWRHAQTGCGWQTAARQIRGGPSALVDALEQAALRRGVELRRGAEVKSIIVEGGRAQGVRLGNGEVLTADAVVSSVGERETLLELVPCGALGFGAAVRVPDCARLGMAELIVGLSGLPPFPGLSRRDFAARLVIAERPEIAAEAKDAALAGRLPEELVMEVTIPSAADPDLAGAAQHVLSALLPYMPVGPQGGWEAHRGVLAKRVVGVLERFAPGLKERIVAHRLFTPDDLGAGSGRAARDVEAPFSRLLASPRMRVRTPIAGLYLCGRSAETANLISGAAARAAAALVASEPPRLTSEAR